MRLRLEAEAAERAIAERAQLAAEAVVRDQEALRVIVAEGGAREWLPAARERAAALRAVETENARLAEEARRKIEDEKAAERARISARITKSKLSKFSSSSAASAKRVRGLPKAARRNSSQARRRLS